MGNSITHKQYVEIDNTGLIHAGWSTVVQPWRNTANAVCIGEWEGDGFSLFPGGRTNPDLLEWEYGIPLYKWDGSQVIARTTEEIEADRAAIPVLQAEPTAQDDTDAMLVDHEYRITLLELGI